MAERLLTPILVSEKKYDLIGITETGGMTPMIVMHKLKAISCSGITVNVKEQEG